MPFAVAALLGGAILYVVSDLTATITGWAIAGLFSAYGPAAMMHDLFAAPWVVTLTGMVQGIAMAVLGVRISWDALHLYILRSSGGGGDPTGLLVRGVKAAAGIFAVPFLAHKSLQASNFLTGAIGSLVAPGADLATSFDAWVERGPQIGGAPMPGSPEAWAASVMGLLVVLVVVIFLGLITLQAAGRGIEMLVLGIVGPALAVGLVSADEGTGAGVWRHLLMLVGAQATQGIMLYVLTALAGAPPSDMGGTGYSFLMIAGAWTAFKAPKFIQEVTGGGGGGMAAAGLARVAASIVSRRPA